MMHGQKNIKKSLFVRRRLDLSSLLHGGTGPCGPRIRSCASCCGYLVRVLEHRIPQTQTYVAFMTYMGFKLTIIVFDR
jgi:hypothetical protein